MLFHHPNGHSSSQKSKNSSWSDLTVKTWACRRSATLHPSSGDACPSANTMRPPGSPKKRTRRKLQDITRKLAISETTLVVTTIPSLTLDLPLLPPTMLMPSSTSLPTTTMVNVLSNKQPLKSKRQPLLSQSKLSKLLKLRKKKQLKCQFRHPWDDLDQEGKQQLVQVSARASKLSTKKLIETSMPSATTEWNKTPQW